ncbi:hypothetical protein ASPVEDRAFT_505803 [Aspergillus versicolor CBS 583.65]|uniref:Uncharacterized protein n=1 Tax=Aspergillus versicolor CBS 583.65 TaxID=1036611 RepID=A0A1L9PCD4_ASPVE|nr:uncharacterized protein ASPVEDRAFT_505803 [Aspergillus versicolor CBS 583.65]OJI99180.1 hypothetical protein ASPVEDRAFT_505803 [Aspergillus versicolor CBS 583.65]
MALEKSVGVTLQCQSDYYMSTRRQNRKAGHDIPRSCFDLYEYTPNLCTFLLSLATMHIRIGPVSSNTSHFCISYRIPDPGKTTLLELLPSGAAPRSSWFGMQGWLSRNWRHALECPNTKIFGRVKLIHLSVEHPIPSSIRTKRSEFETGYVEYV